MISAQKLSWLRWTSIAAFLACPVSGTAQRIEYQKLKPSIIEDRLHRIADKNTVREQTLHTLFEEAGCKDERLMEQPVKGSRTPNVLCTLQGAEDTTVIVGAHYDKADDGQGAVDNWSGASLLPSLFQSLQANPRRMTFVFIGFAAEEKGLVGSKFYVSRLSKQQRATVRAMVNVDSLGLSDTKVWLSYADKKLADAAFRVARALQLPLGIVNVEQVGLSDAGPFREKKIPSIDFHSVTQETFSILHSPRDKLAAVHLPEYQNSYIFLAAYLAYLNAAADPSTEH